MKNRHEAHTCKHSIELCKECDIIYCKNCIKEWSGNSNRWTYSTFPTYWTGTMPLVSSSTTKHDHKIKK